jgi:translation initiation factor RLI1
MLIKAGHNGKPGLIDKNTGYQAKRPSHIIQDPNIQTNEVTCVVGNNGFGETMIVLYVSSTHKPELKARGEIRPGTCKNTADLYFQIEVTAAACAEYLAEQYGDRLDPAECAKAAKDVVIEALLKHQEKQEKEYG